MLVTNATLGNSLIPCLSFSRWWLLKDLLNDTKFIQSSSFGPTTEGDSTTAWQQLQCQHGESFTDHTTRTTNMLFLTGAMKHIFTRATSEFVSKKNELWKDYDYKIHPTLRGLYLHNLYALTGCHPLLMSLNIKYSQYCYLEYTNIVKLCAAAVAHHKALRKVNVLVD